MSVVRMYQKVQSGVVIAFYIRGFVILARPAPSCVYLATMETYLIFYNNFDMF